ncbi:fimbria/pilus periplasmic chaperone [Pseudoduganella sp. DS3]|uniref:Fimbria/pilus periplasmic chaperone n=1 Tax=Pseudoduganella guangdongensis TaxID=2692179 RepID=A0A6N9HLE7_9BURK|nr:molecular chaperone [Pseudoduganella guangdongensis]MYN04330.1 fimbria/pilus periplasmic chaperone [Pseudoduganella guangdongensis]
MRRLALLLFLALPAAAAGAASLQISPVSLLLRGEQSATALQLRNAGEAPIFGQVRVFTWDQKGSEDVLQPTQDVAASPPLVQVGPGETQLIRLIRLGPAAQEERTYRVLIDEITREGEPQAAGVDFRLRYSIPLFMRPAGEPQPPRLAWRLFRSEAGWMLSIANSGGMHAQIGAMTMAAPGAAAHEISKGLFGYVLPGRTREWLLPLPAATPLAAEVQVEAQVNGKPASLTVPVTR